MKDYLLDTKWACGWIKTKDNIVIDCAPIFKKFIGVDVMRLKKVYKLILLNLEK